ncbi:MAG: FAD-dependent oxidoreductase, partial [Gammaproteobacteria bacterium]
MSDSFDVIVIGGGPAGYHAAIRCAQLGLETACIDRTQDPAGKPVLGGTCLNWGCIPSKALLDASHKFVEARDGFADLGIRASALSVDVPTMMARKDAVVAGLTGGVAQLFQGNGVTWLPGSGRLLSGLRVEYTPHQGGETGQAASGVQSLHAEH